MSTSNGLDDTAEVTIDLSQTQPGSIDPAVLRRAMKFGQQCWVRLGGRPFAQVESDLRTHWLRREATEWEWVRAAVRAGYEPESAEDL